LEVQTHIPKNNATAGQRLVIDSALNSLARILGRATAWEMESKADAGNRKPPRPAKEEASNE
jgi:hypothetical protein